ncbi:MAG: efflux RND transporter periplasmic adaptor subunit [Rhizobiales bacterium]|nr:efflux RND transporter periplasmic adaptor subunit [Hyphomicrobiales bacterium]
MAEPASVRLQLLLFVLLAAVAGALWIARAQVGEAVARFSGASDNPQTSMGKRPDKARSVPVIVVEVGQAMNNELIAAVGTARARRSVMLHAQTDGIIVELAPKAGDRVNKGDTIVQLDAAKARLAVQIATRRLQEARRLFNRSEFLKNRSVNSSAKVEDAKTVEERAELELLQAEEAQRDLSIQAPFDGIIGIPNVEVGERVTTTTPLVSLDMRDEVLVEFEVAEKYLSRISNGDPVSGRTPSYEDKKFAGRIEFIDSRVDPTSRTVKVRAVIPNRDDVLRPGMSFVVEVQLPGAEFAVVPELSLQWRKGESYVWIVRNGKAHKTPVRAVNRLNSTILVDGDVQPGQLVVVEGVQRLRPGRPVLYSNPSAVEPDSAGGEQTSGPEQPHKG